MTDPALLREVAGFAMEHGLLVTLEPQTVIELAREIERLQRELESMKREAPWGVYEKQV